MRNTASLRYAGNTNIMAENEEELKSLLMKLKEENERAGLKFSIQNHGIWSHNFTANRTGKMEVDSFYFLKFQNHF